MQKLTHIRILFAMPISGSSLLSHTGCWKIARRSKGRCYEQSYASSPNTLTSSNRFQIVWYQPESLLNKTAIWSKPSQVSHKISEALSQQCFFNSPQHWQVLVTTLSLISSHLHTIDKVSSQRCFFTSPLQWRFLVHRRHNVRNGRAILKLATRGRGRHDCWHDECMRTVESRLIPTFFLHSHEETSHFAIVRR